MIKFAAGFVFCWYVTKEKNLIKIIHTLDDIIIKLKVRQDVRRGINHD